tara:strand:+ start:1368 stop:3965 length:2598 start_codon:yes stop_codon:yes gene_type:complete
MPHIFPRRFLRTRDVLDPTELNDDIHPVYDLTKGRLDRMNFNAGNLKAELRNHPDSVGSDSSTDGACVAEGAYFNTHVSQIESRYSFYPVVGEVGTFLRHPPNFVEADGSTFRSTMGFTGSNPNAYPSIVPNHGAWSAVQDAGLTGAQKLTFTTGQSKIWVSAYAQYIWQGFYEYKKPWINGTRRFGGNEFIDPPGYASSWFGHRTAANLATAERAVLNNTGPSSTWESLPLATTVNTADNLNVYDVPFAFPLNETAGVEDERDIPNKNGYHHISKGFKPCMLQFALRVDGKVIEETITGKRLPFEESPHGLEVTDSIRVKDEDEDQEIWKEMFPDFSAMGSVFGQRSFSVASSFGDRSDSRPGQKLRSSRAVAYGPEVMPVRLGAVVEVGPGEHTIELVVRRLQRKGSKFGVSDYVGVFSRRLLAFDLPLKPKRQEAPGAGESTPPGWSIPGFKTEDKLTDENINSSRQTLGGILNAVKAENLSDNTLSNKYLPSKVVYSYSDVITPELEIDAITGEYRSPVLGEPSSSQAIFSGFGNTTNLNNTVPSQYNGWSTAHVTGDFLNADRVGWYQLQGAESDKLNIDLEPSAQVLRPNEKIILMMDVEVRGIEPIYSEDANHVRNFMTSNPTLGLEVRRLFSNYGNYLLAERYLDLFALFAIGYKEDDEWVIATDSVPAMVNSFNWVNRSPLFSASSDQALPVPLNRLKNDDYWDLKPGWDGYIDGAETWDGFEKSFFFYKTEDPPPPPPLDGLGGYPTPTYARGGRLFRSNLGINIPIMQVIENNTSDDMNITTFGGFTSTMVPSKWTQGHGPSNPRKIIYDFPGFVTAEYNIEKAWASPVGGRDILKGARVYFGNSRLTAIKVVK